MKTVSFTGPECSGKTTLSLRLAKISGGIYVSEAARTLDYLITSGYSLNEIETLARAQIKSEEDAKKLKPGLLICDTDLRVIYVWIQEKFETCPAWIEDELKTRKYDLIFLCKPDLPWIHDPLRENPKDRDRLYARYLESFQRFPSPFVEIYGLGEKRMDLVKAELASGLGIFY